MNALGGFEGGQPGGYDQLGCLIGGQVVLGEARCECRRCAEAGTTGFRAVCEPIAKTIDGLDPVGNKADNGMTAFRARAFTAQWRRGMVGIRARS